MFTFIFENGTRPIHFIQANNKKEAINKLNKIMNYGYYNIWDSIGQSIRVIETKYLGIKVHVGSMEEIEI